MRRAQWSGCSSDRTTTAAGASRSSPTTTRAWKGRGETTASQTGWAVLGLIAAGALADPRGAAARAPRRSSCAARRPQRARTGAGTTSTGPAPASPGCSTCATTCYACYFPLQALAAYVRASSYSWGRSGRLADDRRRHRPLRLHRRREARCTIPFT